MKKKNWIGLSSILAILLLAIVACTKEPTPDPVYPGGGGGSGSGSGGSGGSAPSVPTGVSAMVSGSSIKVSWNSVSNATSYTVYYSTDGYSYNYTIGTTSNTYIYDNVPYENNYYKVKAINSYGESSLSSSVYCHYSTGGGGGGGGSDVTPAAPTGVTAEDCGPRMYPYALISWNYVSGVDHWDVYRSTSYNGSYSKKGSNVSMSWADESVSCGNTYYYKVKAVSASGKQSDFSAVASVYIRREGE